MKNSFIKQQILRLKRIRIGDILATIPMLVSFPCSLLLRLWHNNVWLICERKEDARDNGYWFFKYVVENHKEIEAIYAIDKESPDYNKVAALGHVIQFGSFAHWVYYWLAKRNISSQKEGKPNAAVCYVLEVFLGLRRNRVFLQHGITKDNARWLYYDVSKFNLFACAVKDEYDYISRGFHYPPGIVQLCGFCRYDNLLTPHNIKRQILVMPTMRDWLRMKSSETLKYEVSFDFTQSVFYRCWTSFINSSQLNDLLIRYNLDLVFYLHASMQRYAECFKSDNDHIVLGRPGIHDVQQLLMESSLLVTDYSSIYFDFAYMEKPLIYYQFDYEKYRSGQYEEGYFSYEQNGFGPVVKTETTLLDELEKSAKNGFVLPDKYEKRIRDFFTYRDMHNCERTYNAIVNMKIR